MEQRSSMAKCYNVVLCIKAKVVVRMAELVCQGWTPAHLAPICRKPSETVPSRQWNIFVVHLSGHATTMDSSLKFTATSVG